jgi:flagellar basal-body rod modification protein FlgD
MMAAGPPDSTWRTCRQDACGTTSEKESIMPTVSATSGLAAGTQLKTASRQLQTEDFIKMMLTQLQHQDPLNPAKNEDLMAQMAQIGQIQANNQMQELLTSLAKLNQVGSAGQLIGKMVQGLTDSNEPVSGIVTSVRIENNQVSLELDNGQAVRLDRVTFIGAADGTALAAAA